MEEPIDAIAEAHYRYSLVKKNLRNVMPAMAYRGTMEKACDWQV